MQNENEIYKDEVDRMLNACNDIDHYNDQIKNGAINEEFEKNFVKNMNEFVR